MSLFMQKGVTALAKPSNLLLQEADPSFLFCISSRDLQHN